MFQKIFMNNNFNYRLEILKDKQRKLIRLTQTFNGTEKVIAEKEYDLNEVFLRIWSSGPSQYNFDFAVQKNQWIELKHQVDATILGRRFAGGFTGTMVGLYASSNGQNSDNFADYDWFEYSAE